MIYFLVRWKYVSEGYNAYFRISEHCFHSYCWTAHISIAFENETFLHGNKCLALKNFDRESVMLDIFLYYADISILSRYLEDQP